METHPDAVRLELRIAFINKCFKQAIEYHKQGVRHLNISESTLQKDVTK